MPRLPRLRPTDPLRGTVTLVSSVTIVDLFAVLDSELRAKLDAIEAKYVGEGADPAPRVHDRLAQLRRIGPDTEHQFKVEDGFARYLFLSLANRYGIKPYRYQRQREFTIILSAPESFVHDFFSPGFNDLHIVLHEHLRAITMGAVDAEIHQGPPKLQILHTEHHHRHG